MKTLKSNLLSILLILLLTVSCKKENDQSAHCNVKFSFRSDQSLQLKSLKTDSMQVSALIISIETPSGEVIYEKEKLELIFFEGNYITNNIKLKEGTYSITEFMVVDIANNVIYAVPKKGSALEDLVHNPLPYNFKISTSEANIIAPQVIATEGSSSEDFGYPAFSFQTVNILKLMVSAICINNVSGVPGAISTNLTIRDVYDSKPIRKFSLPQSLNTVYFKNDLEKYIITVWTSGYYPWSDTLTAVEISKYSNNPLVVYLKRYDVIPENITFYGIVSNNGELSPYIITETPSNFILEWGDGISEKVTSPFKVPHLLENCYGDHEIKIWGPVTMITGISLEGCLKCFGHIIQIKDMNIRSASNLKTLSSAQCLNSISYDNLNSVTTLNLNHGCFPLKFQDFPNLKNLVYISSDGYIDISNNYKLESLEIESPDSIIFGNSKVTEIRVISEQYYPQLNTNQLDKIVTDLLKNVELYPRSGKFVCYLQPTLAGDVAKMRLINEFGWTFLLYNN